MSRFLALEARCQDDSDGDSKYDERSDEDGSEQDRTSPGASDSEKEPCSGSAETDTKETDSAPATTAATRRRRGQGSRRAARVANQPAPKFRKNAKNFCLTYSQVGDEWTLDDFTNYIKQQFLPVKYVVGMEYHEAGGKHFHVLLCYRTKRNIKDPAHFDLRTGTKNRHPNIADGYDIAGWADYCKKDGNYLANYWDWVGDAVPDDKYVQSWNGHRLRMHHSQQSRRLPVTWPLTVKDRMGFVHSLQAPKKDSPKNRHWWIVGEPNAGKSYFMEWNPSCSGRKVYYRPAETNYPFDDYDGEDLIVYDDVYPVFQELANVTETSSGNRAVYGNTRYYKRYWPAGEARNIVVLVNRTIDEAFSKAPQSIRDAVHARFTEITNIDFRAQ